MRSLSAPSLRQVLRTPLHRWWLFLASLSLASFAPAAEASMIYGIKAGYLFNFLRFADWPETSLPPRAVLRLAVAADDATFRLISTSLEGKVANDHPLAIERFTAGSAPPHLLFLTASAPPADRAAVTALSGTPVLTIGEHEGFAAREGIINFVLVDEAVRFEVNLASAQRAGLRISSRLSKVAILIRSGATP